MIPLACVLICVGVGDLIAGSSGSPARKAPGSSGSIVAIVLAPILACLLGFDPGWATRMTLVVASVMCVWVWLRSPENPSPKRGRFGLAGGAIVILGLGFTGAGWQQVDGGQIAKWLERVPLPNFDHYSIETVMLAAGLICFLLATSNGMVRLVLAISGSQPNAAKKLKGGRVIGPIERLLIFGFLVGGQPTAAALIVSAKALLRFPEVGREDEVRDVHDLTEYLLVGSLASWVIAFLAALLLRAVAQ